MLDKTRFFLAVRARHSIWLNQRGTWNAIPITNALVYASSRLPRKVQRVKSKVEHLREMN